MPEFDFSRFHPLDHRVGVARCRKLPGGPLNHARLALRYQRPVWVADARAATLCRVGWHRRETWTDTRGVAYALCPDCGRELLDA